MQNPPTVPPLAEAAELARRGVPVPWDLTAHRERCQLCQLDGEQLAEIEARYLAWHLSKELAAEAEVSTGCLRRHAAVFLWDLRRLAELAPAWSQLIEAGISKGDAGAREALAALKYLQGAQDRAFGAGRGERGRVLEGGAITDTETGPAGVGVVLSYEEKVRRVRAAVAAGEVDPVALRQAIEAAGALPEGAEDDGGGASGSSAAMERSTEPISVAPPPTPSRTPRSPVDF